MKVEMSCVLSEQAEGLVVSSGSHLEETFLSSSAIVWDPLFMEESRNLEIPIWLGGESGQRKRYLRSLEQDLLSELGPDWRQKIQSKQPAA